MPNLELDNTELELVEGIRILGIVISADLRWTENIERNWNWNWYMFGDIKESLHVKYKFSLKWAKMCTDMPAIFIFFQKLMCHLLGANRVSYCLLFDPHPSSLSPSSSYSMPHLLSLFDPTPRRRAKEYEDEGQRVEGWGAESRRMRVKERTILSPVCFLQVIH